MRVRLVKKSSGFNNAVWIISCRVVQAVLSLFIGMWTARYLGPSNYGLINYASSLASFVAPIAYLGINEVLVLELVNSPQDEGKTMGTSIVISIIMSFICILGIGLFVVITSPNELDTIIVCSFYSITLFFRAFQIIQYWFQSKLLSKYASIASVFIYIFVSVFKAILLITGKNVYWFVFCCVLDETLIAGSLIWLYKKLNGGVFSFSKEKAGELIYKSKSYIIPNLMIAIFAQTDRIMLKLMVDNVAAGIYSAAMVCCNMSSFVFVAIIDSFRPSIFSWKNQNQKLYEERLKQLNCIIIYLSLIQCIVFMIFSNQIISILYGSSYIEAGLVLKILVWYTLFSYLGSTRNIWILAENKQKLLWIINVVGAVMNIVLNYFLIPIYGASGAAFASVFTQFFMNIVMCLILKQYREGIKLIIQSFNPKYCVELIRNRMK